MSEKETKPSASGSQRDLSGIDREALRAYEHGQDLSDGGKYGPLGAGHDPAKDPLKGLRGVMAGTLVMQSISVLLGLTVVSRVDGGSIIGHTAGMAYIAILGVVLFLLAFVQQREWAVKANIVTQVFSLLSFVAHWSMGFVGVIFALVWLYIFHLRKNLLQRMERGLLTTQHM